MKKEIRMRRLPKNLFMHFMVNPVSHTPFLSS